MTAEFDRLVAEQVAAATPLPAARWQLPTQLSVSRAGEYRQCPRRFFYRSITRLPDPTGPQAAIGTIVHSVLEAMFTQPASLRTREWCQQMLETVLASTLERNPHLAGEQLGLLLTSEACLDNYFTLEDPTKADGDIQVEVRVAGTFGQAPVVGVIDRLEVVGDRARITDYKTGRAKRGRQLDEAFDQLHVYAALATDTLGLTIDRLRLVYLSTTDAYAIAERACDPKALTRVRRQIENTWLDLNAEAETGEWDTRAGWWCNWCPFISICPEHAALDAGPRPEPFDPRRDRAGE